ncbi:MAG: fumarylacetoacetate hydrolase family protein [Actinomycetota bacterium]
MTSDFDAEQIAELILDARQRREPIAPLTDAMPLSMPQAYQVQMAVTRRRVGFGHQIVGWKLGYTSQAMRTQMGVAEMNFGPLTDAMALPNASKVPGGAIQPLVEPEAAFVMARELRAPCAIQDVLTATQEVRACLEVVDPIWTDRRFRIEDNTADGSSAAFYVLGDPLDHRDLPSLQVVLFHDGEPVGTATGAAASGHPASGVAWLAAKLAQRQLSLRPGDIVLSGGLTRAQPLEPGHEITAEFTHGTSTTRVSVSR